MYFSRQDLGHLGGICILFKTQDARSEAKALMTEWCERIAAPDYLNIIVLQHEQWFVLQLTASDTLRALTPSYNTVDLSKQLGLESARSTNELDLEIVLAMACGPRAYCFPSCDEFYAALRIRRYSAVAARKTQLAFATEGAERPIDCWSYQEDKGFVLNPGVMLFDALIKTIQPKTKESSYTFSCSRACEHVLLLALVQELEQTHPELLGRIEALWRNRALLNVDFNDAFVYEHGKLENPLPMKFYVPGDRVWFRNPDESSADVTGFEGSWVIYLGAGQFSNFWDPTQPTSLEQKCIEVYHWRHGAERRANGELWMNEPLVAHLVAKSANNKVARQEIIVRMMRIRDGSGIYANGGFIDATRDEIRWVCPATHDIKVDNFVP